MSTQAELVKDSLQRIRRIETLIEKYPDEKAVKILFEEEKELLEKMEKSN